MKIEYPSPLEIERQAKIIAQKGLMKKHCFFYHLRDMYRNIGLRIIFHDMADVIFIALTVTVIINSASINIVKMKMDGVPGLIFTTSPIIYMFLCLLTLWKERMSGTYDVKMSCKYTVYHLIAFRMFIFSLLSILVNTCTIKLLYLLGYRFDFWNLFEISVCSLFLFSVIFLYGLLQKSGLAIVLWISCLWITLNVILFSLSPLIYNRFLQQIPPLVHIFVTCALAVFYVSGLNKLILGQKEGRTYIC